MHTDAAAVRSGTPFVERRRTLKRELVMDAARDQLLARAWDEISMQQVARVAGVHRTTLYAEFGTRAALLRALASREGGSVLRAVGGELEEHAASPPRALEAAFLAFLHQTRENGLIAALVRRDTPELLAIAGARRVGFTARLAAVLSETWPLLASEDAEHLSELILRFAVSVAFAPVRDPDQTALHVGRILGFWVNARCRQGAATG